MPIKVELKRDEIHLTDKIAGFYRKQVTPYGNGAHVICPKEHRGETAYLVVCKE